MASKNSPAVDASDAPATSDSAPAMTRDAACNLLGIGEATLDALIDRGDIAADLSDVEAFAAK